MRLADPGPEGVEVPLRADVPFSISDPQVQAELLLGAHLCPFVPGHFPWGWGRGCRRPLLRIPSLQVCHEVSGQEEDQDEAGETLALNERIMLSLVSTGVSGPLPVLVPS